MNNHVEPLAEIPVTAATLAGRLSGAAALLVIACLVIAKRCRRTGERYRATAVFALAGSLMASGVPAVSDESTSGTGLTFLGAPVTTDQITRGQEIYAKSCASCHGAKLEGQPDWKRRNDDGRMPAPPHDETGHTWHHSDRQLFTITKLGVSAVVPGYESDMPAFEGILTDDEIAAVLAYIKSTWPGRQRGFQAEVTTNDGSGS